MIKERPQVIAIQELHPAQSDWPFENITQDQWVSGSYEELQQRILVLLEPARNGYQIEKENQRLREKIGSLEDMLDMDLDDLLDSHTVKQWDRDTVLTPYAPERIEARLTDLKSKYQQSPHILIEEIEEIARSAWRSLDGNYRRDYDRRQREEIRTKIQQITELIPAEKDALIGLVEENLSRYPTLDSEMAIPVGQFNRRHVGLKDDNTVTKKFRALESIGVLLDYKPGEIDKSNPERPFTTPARMRLNPDMVLMPSTIKKPDQLKPGGNRQTVCKVPDCPGNNLHNEVEHRTDKYSMEYCHLTDTVVVDSLPGLSSDSDVHRALNAIEEGRIYITEQLHRFAENAQQQTIEAQKHDAFEDIATPTSTNIYVDDVVTYDTKLPYKQWCHMATDGPIEELHAMADQLHLKREWFQNKPGHPHYDLTPSKRKQAIAFGAIATSSQELIRACYPRLAAVMDTQKHDAFHQLSEIGYRKPQALEMIDQAIEQDPSLIIIDIRHTPASRNPLWTKSAFEKRFSDHYTWLPELGNINHHEKGSIKIADPQKGITKLAEILQEHPAILLCGCPEYSECHRKVVADLFYREHSGGILPLTIEAQTETRCTTCHITINQAEEFYFAEDGTPYCCQHGPQAHPQIGQRVDTPAGPGTLSNIQYVENLLQWRCSVITDQIQENGSHYQAFNLSEIHVAQQ